MANQVRCAFHGGKSTGPKTQAGRDRIAAAKTIHGNETREARSERKLAVKRLADLETLARALGIIVGARSQGRRAGT